MDRYFTIRYRLGGKQIEEAWGWESEGCKAADASVERQKIMLGIKSGSKVITLVDRKAEVEREHLERVYQQEAEKKSHITFTEYFNNHYLTNKPERTFKHEAALFRKWIKPVIRNKKFTEITEMDMFTIQKNVLNAGRSRRTVDYCYAVIRQTFNMANGQKYSDALHPITKAVRKKNRYDNRRVRFFTYNEAKLLLEELSKRSKQVHDMALLSLYCGLRAGECFALDWCDIDLGRRNITLRNTKNNTTRFVPMPETVVAMFEKCEMGKGNTPVFSKVKMMRGKPVNGERIESISRSYRRAVERLKFNKGITDNAQKVTFHTLRHTFASWLAISGIPIYTIQQLLGHKSLKVTIRYAHLSPENFKKAAEVLSRIECTEYSDSGKV